ncbi:hypothetical protein [Tahibacter amnicola]|uniref:Uncharacterized protein n=1 Tax=Tahibacter amnicola TaxID=2976241 RepID=A0ABY6B8P8_9GAMM|nr:hypothetical protein [Tahibacter amnicola]UXI66456.1 hypothetical protein N4264_17090 [Tahibacter amnicola]
MTSITSPLSTRSEVADAIVSYVVSHPQAADTLDGIVDWWLPQQRYETERGRIKRTLDRLVSCGVLSCRTLADGATLYALAEGLRADAKGPSGDESAPRDP